MPSREHNTPEEKRHLEQPRRRVAENRPGPPSSNSPWLWPVVILLALLFWLGFWAWTSCGGWWGRHSHKGGLSSNTELRNRPDANTSPRPQLSKSGIPRTSGLAVMERMSPAARQGAVPLISLKPVLFLDLDI
jgi:hypothetical protein